MQALFRALIVVAVVAGLGYLGHLDHQDELQQEAHYCDMVQSGAWPDFSERIDCLEAGETRSTGRVQHPGLSGGYEHARVTEAAAFK